MTRPDLVPVPDGRSADKLDIALGVAIRMRRRYVGVSQSDLAYACGITFQQVQKYENGRNRVAFSRLVQIARALRCRAADLIEAGGGGCVETPVGPEELRLLAVPGANALLSAYESLPPQARKPLVALLRAVAG